MVPAGRLPRDPQDQHGSSGSPRQATSQPEHTRPTQWAGSGPGNPIDRLLAGYFQENNFKPTQPVDDRTFARRVWLDLVGLLPPVNELEKFVADTSPEKRADLVDHLLQDNRAYADHWMSFWNDHLRNAYFGPGFIDNGRAQITAWLYRALYTNTPYDQFVRELISGTNGASGFVKGIKWRGAVNEIGRAHV